MFNIDRYATKNMGYDIKQYPNMLCIEGESNSDVGSSAFFSYSNPQSSGNQFPNEVAYHNEGWRVVYPNTINEDAWNFAPVKRLVDFVSDSSDDKEIVIVKPFLINDESLEIGNVHQV